MIWLYANNIRMQGGKLKWRVEKKGQSVLGMEVRAHLRSELWKGWPLKKHIEGAHPEVSYSAYHVCFYGAKNVLADTWSAPTTSGGTPVLIHTFVRRFVQDPGPRGVTRTVRQK